MERNKDDSNHSMQVARQMIASTEGSKANDSTELKVPCKFAKFFILLTYVYAYSNKGAIKW